MKLHRQSLHFGAALVGVIPHAFFRVLLSSGIVLATLLGALVALEIWQAHRRHGGLVGVLLYSWDGDGKLILDINRDGVIDMEHVEGDHFKIQTDDGSQDVFIPGAKHRALGPRWEKVRTGRIGTYTITCKDGRRYKMRHTFEQWRRDRWILWPLLPALGFAPDE